MRTSQLTTLLRKRKDTRKIFTGVYPCNRIPRSIPENAAFIVNTDPHDKPGKHWVAYFFTPSRAYFFDSYGQAPWKNELQRPMAMRKMKTYFGRRLQGHSSEVCGHYCLYFILAMIHQLGFSRFGTNFEKNDILVKKFVDRNFSPYK